MAALTLPAPPLPQLMEALMELESGKAGPASLALANAALRAGLPRKSVSAFLVEVVRAARELREHLLAAPPDFDLTVAILTPDQALAYLYEVEQAVPGPISALIAKNWGGLDYPDRSDLIATTLGAARNLREHWQSQIGPVRWHLAASA
jgi:hypothetical protein